MRVITGKARGRKLAAPEGLEVRPTTEIAKEGIFSAIQFEIEQASVLDLFSGSGQMGIEALSRGAKSCVFVDKSRDSQKIIRQNLEHTGLLPDSKLVQMDAVSFLNVATERFDIVFMDPPYQMGFPEKILPLVERRMGESGIIVCETGCREELPKTVGEFSLHRQYRYGQSKATIYRKENSY